MSSTDPEEKHAAAAAAPVAVAAAVAVAVAVPERMRAVVLRRFANTKAEAAQVLALDEHYPVKRDLKDNELLRKCAFALSPSPLLLSRSFSLSLSVSLSMCVCMYVCVYMYVCMYICMCVRACVSVGNCDRYGALIYISPFLLCFKYCSFVYVVALF